MDSHTVYRDAESVARAAATAVAASIQRVLARARCCHIALPGGTTPARCLEILAKQDLPWDRIHWYLGDERCLPRGNAQRNDCMIENCLWSQVPVPDGNRHSIPAELGADAAADIYSSIISEIDMLDIVLLGMGEDGHTASLFPGNAALSSTAAAVAVHDAPKPPAERVSLGLTTLQQAAERHVLVTGAAKHDAMCRLRAGEALPAARIGDAHWYVDEAAACEPTHD